MLVPELFNDSMFDDFFQDMGFPFYNDHDMRIYLMDFLIVSRFIMTMKKI